MRFSKGMVDSGANIGITSYDIARLYGRKILAYEEPLVIHGVGEITTTAVHFADFGPILGEMALLRSVGATIISVSGITQKGYVVMFDSKSVRVVGKRTGEVFMGSFDEETRLFYIDIGLVLQHNSLDEADVLENEVKDSIGESGAAWLWH